MTYQSDIIFKLGKLEISRGTNARNHKFFSINVGHAWLTFDECGLIGGGRITETINWEININRGYDNLYFNSVIGRYCDHYLYLLQFNIFKIIDFMFDIHDNREWDYYQNKRTYEIYDYYNNTTLTYPVGVKPYFKRRKQKAKWYLNTQFLKIYNLDFLNNPWGLTFDLAFFPLLVYTKFGFGVNKLSWFNFDINLEKSKTTGLTFKFKLNLFSRFIEFEIGEKILLDFQFYIQINH